MNILGITEVDHLGEALSIKEEHALPPGPLGPMDFSNKVWTKVDIETFYNTPNRQFSL